MSVHTFYPSKFYVLPHKRWPLYSLFHSERNHQVADKFRKMRFKRLNIHGRKRELLTLRAWYYGMEKINHVFVALLKTC